MPVEVSIRGQLAITILILTEGPRILDHNDICSFQPVRYHFFRLAGVAFHSVIALFEYQGKITGLPGVIVALDFERLVHALHLVTIGYEVVYLMLHRREECWRLICHII